MPKENGLEWFQLLAVMVPAILAPFIAWFLSQRGVSRQSKEFEWLLRRTELVERLQTLLGPRDARNIKYEEALNAEVDDIVGDLSALRESEREEERLAGGLSTKHLPRWRSYLLIYKQASLVASIYRILFYLFLIWTMMVGAFLIDNLLFTWRVYLMLSSTDPTYVEDFRLGYQIIGGTIMISVNLMIGLLFRIAAVRTHKRKLKKSLIEQGAGT